jgi:hypothetical protein
MLAAMQILTVILVAFAMAPALAHALELPGKMRLAKQEYFVTQRIYYPGFTIGGGIGEVGGFISTAVLVFLTPSGSVPFYLTLAALVGLIAMQAVYWIAVHPVNRVWLESALQSKTPNRFGFSFFSFGRRRDRTAAQAPEWTDLRDRWEYSHVVRAMFATLSFILLVVSIPYDVVR